MWIGPGQGHEHMDATSSIKASDLTLTECCAGRIFEKLQQTGTGAQLLNAETLPKIMQVR